MDENEIPSFLGGYIIGFLCVLLILFTGKEIQFRKEVRQEEKQNLKDCIDDIRLVKVLSRKDVQTLNELLDMERELLLREEKPR